MIFFDASAAAKRYLLLDLHPLKALDSLYLAGAVGLQRALKEPVLFVSADRQLLQAAQAEGLRALDPEMAP
jgi:predicted nucleic acid-binding protein